jgi:D-glycero-D-manno-heptose 1,7-bisphosphate phosphatase
VENETGRYEKMSEFAVFLDRDGTITEEVGYLTDSRRLRLLPGSAEAINLLNKYDIPAIVATNQAGVARGYFREEMVIECNEKLRNMLAILGAKVDAIYYCPHHPDGSNESYRKKCECRKPKPGMLLKAQKEFLIDLNKSYVIGDKESDLEFARSVGAHPILVETGYGYGEVHYNKENWKVEAEGIFSNIFKAVSYIIEKEF